MSNEPPIGCGDDELERRIAELESEAWLGSLKELNPVQGVDLFAIGFEAGKQAALVSSQSVRPANTSWFHARTAISSSVVSVAATLLIMFALADGTGENLISPGTSEVAKQVERPANEVERVSTQTAENEAHPSVQEPDPSFNDAFAEVPSIWRDRLQGIEIKVPNTDDTNRVVDVEPTRLRYAFQRRQLIENLGETIQ